MPDGFQNTALWRRTLGLQDESDQFAGARDTLRDAYLSMRKNAAELVKLIPQDCRSLTVHDITHLDALWETADLISGPDFPINPAEAFVFGAAILLHDAGMTVAAYPGGMAEIAQTTEWKDAVYAFTGSAICRNRTEKLYKTRQMPLEKKFCLESYEVFTPDRQKT